MSLSAKHKQYKREGGKLGFAEWVTLYDRLVSARKARGQVRVSPKARKVVKWAPETALTTRKKVATEYVRVENRVDCFGTSKKGITILGADASDGKRVAKLCNGKVVSTYTSKRGERARIEVKGAVNVSKLAAAGFTPKGF